MAKKTSLKIPAKSNLKAINKSQEFEISKTIEVRNVTSDLVVKGKLDCKKATWKLTVNLTTTQVDPSNPSVTTGIIQQIGMMIEEAVLEATKLRAEVLEGKENDDTIEFPED